MNMMKTSLKVRLRSIATMKKPARGPRSLRRLLRFSPMRCAPGAPAHGMPQICRRRKSFFAQKFQHVTDF